MQVIALLFVYLLSTDVNECQVLNICSVSGVCVNTDGSYLCSCKQGYEGNGTHCRGRYYRYCSPVSHVLCYLTL